MKERPVQFGPGRRLLGILSSPETPDPQRPVILLPNTGVEHRVGPNRLHIHLCRAFAQLGFVSLRLDLSGMGDSSLPPGRRCDAVADLRAAMDHLQRLGLGTRFVAIGLCSGGNDAHLLARADARVVAAGFIDHYQYATPKSFLIQLLQKVSDPRRAANFFRRKWHQWSGRPNNEYFVELLSYFEQPSREAFLRDLDVFMERRMALFFLFSGENQTAYNYAEQLYDVCPALRGYPHQALHYFPRCDHTFTQLAMRARLIEALEQWLRAHVLTEPRAVDVLAPARSKVAEPSVLQPINAAESGR